MLPNLFDFIVRDWALNFTIQFSYILTRVRGRGEEGREVRIESVTKQWNNLKSLFHLLYCDFHWMLIRIYVESIFFSDLLSLDRFFILVVRSISYVIYCTNNHLHTKTHSYGGEKKTIRNRIKAIFFVYILMCVNCNNRVFGTLVKYLTKIEIQKKRVIHTHVLGDLKTNTA